MCASQSCSFYRDVPISAAHVLWCSCPCPRYPPTHVSPSCRLTFASPHHTSHVPGEVFDITCFTGINQYHCLRAEGKCNAAQLSSQHIRSTDMESACNGDEAEAEALARKEAFEAATRKRYLQSLTYMASIHLAWEKQGNDERVTPSSFCCMQSSRGDLRRMEAAELDPQASIVTVIMDVVTDQRHFHFVTEKAGPSTGPSTGPSNKAKVLQKGAAVKSNRLEYMNVD